MPHSHYGHIDQKACTGSLQTVSEPFLSGTLHDEAGEEKVAEPVGETDVPAIPEFFDVFADKGSAEIIRSHDSQHIADTHSHQAVSGKVKEHKNPYA